MSVIEGISIMSKSGCDDKELLDYIYENYNEIECELIGDEYKEPKHNRNFCINCNLEMTIDGGKKLVPDDVMEAIRNEMRDGTNILYKYTIPITIPILECILKRNELMIYKDSIYFIFFKLSGVPFPHITTKEYHSILNVFNVVSSIYNKYKSKGRKSFLNYYFVLKKILIMLGKVEYAKYIPPLKTCAKQNELELVWNLITNDPEWAIALRK